MTSAARKHGGDRKALLAKVHIAKKHLGLDDATYRAALFQVTGHESAGDCTDAELVAVVEHFKSRGFVARRSRGKRKASSDAERRYLPKLRALWLSGHHLGVVNDPSDDAMVKFVKRQTGLDHVRFMQNSADAVRAIEGLKAWLGREGGVVWSDYPDNPRAAVVAAQWSRLHLLRPLSGDEALTRTAETRSFMGWTFEGALERGDVDKLISQLGEEIRSAMVPEEFSTQ